MTPSEQKTERKEINDGLETIENFYFHAHESFFLTLIFLILAALIIIVPITTQIINALDVESTITPAGRVTSTEVIGIIGSDTQVTTTEQTFLVRGIAKLPEGLFMEVRQNQYNTTLCIKGMKNNCWRLGELVSPSKKRASI